MGIYRGTYYSASSCSGFARPGARALMSWYLGAHKSRAASNLGIYVCKRLGSGYSIHGDGRACDLGTSPYGGVDSTWGWALANALRLNSAELGIQLIILGNRVWSCRYPDSGWRAYSGAWHGHAHVELTPSAARSLTVTKLQSTLSGSSSTPSTSLVPTPPLRENDTGPRVGHLQRSLNEALGLKLAVDDDFGPATKAGVIALQRTAGITQDGIYGTDSARALTDLLEDDMQADERIPFPEWGQRQWDGLGDTILVRTALASGYAHSREAKDRAKQIQAEQAAARKRDEAILQAVKGVDTKAILDAIERAAVEDAARDTAAADALAEIASLVAKVGSGELAVDEFLDALAARLIRADE